MAKECKHLLISDDNGVLSIGLDGHVFRMSHKEARSFAYDVLDLIGAPTVDDRNAEIIAEKVLEKING